MTSKLYDRLKFITQIGLPAFGTLYFALAGIWGLPSAEQVVGTIVAVDTFLGVLLQLSSNAYKNSGAGVDGLMNVFMDPEGKKIFQLHLNGDPEELEESDSVVFKVNKVGAPPE